VSQVTHEAISPQLGKLRVVVRPEDYRKEVDDKVRDYVKRANIKGFRKGMVPAGVIKRMFGDQIIAEALSHSVNHGINDYMKESGLKILGDPIPDEKVRPDLDIAAEKEYEFMYDIALQPEIDLASTLAAAKLARYIVKADDEMIDKEVERLQERYGEVEKAEEIGAQDIIHVHLTELEGAEPKPGGLHEHAAFWFKDLTPETQARFQGKKVDEEVDLDVFTLMDRPESVIREKVLHLKDPGIAVGRLFRIRIGGISRTQKAEMGQKLFDTIYGEGAVANELDFRDRVSQELRAALEQGTRMRLEADIFEYLVTQTPIDLPEDFLRRWLLLENKELDSASLEKEFPPFIRNLRWNLIVNKIQSSNGIQVAREEIEQYFRELIMRQYGLNDNSEEARHELGHFVEHMMEDQDQVKRAFESIRDNKIFAFLRQSLRIEEKVVSFEEFKQLTDNNQPK
jgi:trigger factor